MSKTFNYCLRNVYGQFKAYPTNDVAERFAELLNVKTFSARQLQQIAALGFDLRETPDHKAEL